MDVFDLSAKITLNTSEYESGLSDAKSKTSKFADALKTGLKNAGKVSAAAVGAAGTAIVGLGKIGLEYNAQMESYTTDFAVMLGDTEAALQKVEELKEMGASTPFEMSDLADATKTLLAFNVSGEDTNAVLSKLGDISLGDTQKLSSLTRAYGKMNASQKVTLEDINMMIDAGFNPLLVVAEETGETMSELYDRISDGEVSFEEIQSAIETATSTGGQFYQGMQMASQTTQGMISTLKDNVNALIGEVFMPISDGLLSNVLPSAIGAIDELSNAFKENGVDGMIEAAGDIIGETIGTFTSSLPEFVDTAVSIVESLVKGIFDNLDTIAEGAIETVVTLIEGITEMLPEIIVTGTLLIGKLIVGLIEAIPALVRSIPKIVKAIVDEFVANKGIFLDIGRQIVNSIVEGMRERAQQTRAMEAAMSSPAVGAFPLDGSHALGLDYVPFDGYVAELHKGEMVLTEAQAKSLRKLESGSVSFARSGLGKSSAGIINGMSGIGSAASSPSVLNIMLPDGSEFARYYLPSFINVANANGTPILNPT